MEADLSHALRDLLLPERDDSSVLLNSVHNIDTVRMWILKPRAEAVEYGVQLSIRDQVVAIVDFTGIPLQEECNELDLGVVRVLYSAEMPVGIERSVSSMERQRLQILVRHGGSPPGSLELIKGREECRALVRIEEGVILNDSEEESCRQLAQGSPLPRSAEAHVLTRHSGLQEMNTPGSETPKTLATSPEVLGE